MRKLFLCLGCFFLAGTASAQLSAAAGGGYTHFMGDYNKGSFGYLLRMLYEKKKYGIAVTVSDQAPFRKSLAPATDFEFRPLSIDLAIRRTLVGSGTKINLYGALGGSWAMVRYQEKPNATAIATPSLLVNGQTQYLTANATIGAEYRPGIISFFSEAMLAQPFSKAYINGNINSIGPRLAFQLGIKLPFNGLEAYESEY